MESLFTRNTYDHLECVDKGVVLGKYQLGMCLVFYSSNTAVYWLNLIHVPTVKLLKTQAFFRGTIGCSLMISLKLKKNTFYSCYVLNIYITKFFYQKDKGTHDRKFDIEWWSKAEFDFYCFLGQYSKRKGIRKHRLEMIIELKRIDSAWLMRLIFFNWMCMCYLQRINFLSGEKCRKWWGNFVQTQESESFQRTSLQELP